MGDAISRSSSGGESFQSDDDLDNKNSNGKPGRENVQIRSRGELEASKKLLLKSLDLHTRKQAGPSIISNTLNNLGAILCQLNDYKGAQKRLEEALEIRERSDADSWDVANTYNNLGFLLLKQGQVPKALEKYQRALSIQQKQQQLRGAGAGAGMTVASTHSNIGCALREEAWSLRRQGESDKAFTKFQEALEHFQKSLSLIQEQSQEDLHTQNQWLAEANSYNLVALVLHDMGQPRDALNQYDNALELLLLDSVVVADIYNNKGLALQDLEHFHQANECFHKAADIYENLDPNSLGACTVEKNIELLQRDHGDKLVETPTKSRPPKYIKGGFFSHTGKDESAANFTAFVYDNAKTRGIPCFCDFADIPPGVTWANYIENSVVSCRAFVAILSPSYFTRYWCMHELDLAIRYHRPILPVYYSLSGPVDLPDNQKKFSAPFRNEKDQKRVKQGEMDQWFDNVHRG